MASSVVHTTCRRAFRCGSCLVVGWCWLTPALVLAQAEPTAASKLPFNLHVVVTEALLNSFVSRREVEQGPICETIYDVAVQGQRLSVSDLRLDLLPSVRGASARLILDGTIHTQTTGVSEMAVVRSVGWQRFRASKDVVFDGENFSTRHALVDVHVCNQPFEFHTAYDGTLAEGLANYVAALLTEQRRPLTDEHSRQRVIHRVQPQFDRHIDQVLAQANEALETYIRNPLRQRELLPAIQRITSTDRHLHYAAAIGIGAEATVTPPRASLLSTHAINLYVHETAFNELLDRLQLKGLRTTDRGLRSLSVPWRLPGGDQPDAAAEPPRGMSLNFETEIEFDAERPLWVELQDDRLRLRLRVAVHPAGQYLVPPVEVSIPFHLEERGDHWQLTAGAIDIRSRRDGTPLPNVVAAMIREAIQAKLDHAVLPRELPIPNWPEGKPRLKLSAARAADGWLAISFD